ncbi:MAG: ParB/RepB/Spo0J family partition protein [Planctomycetes bacterium]|nr:ParB/RepB/Spo0J family partition protein [Planctomycetota bacterium]
MTYQQIEINHLERSPLNVRKTDSHAAMEELKASIVAHGLMQNLVVVPAKKGKFSVVAGGRRLEALIQLRDEGKLPDDHSVPCRIADPAEAAELSLAENTVRQAMHPADEFEAFAALIEQKLTAAQVAERFGTTERHVLQRMKLGRVAPKLLTAYRAGDVTLDALMAFAVTDDHKRQLSVWKSLEGWQVNNVRQIRGKLTDTLTDADDDVVKFVGLEAYRAAGGRVREDLFSEDVYLEDSALLERLANEKLDAEVEKLRAEGWGWVEIESDDSIPAYRCGRIEAKPVDAPEELLSLQSQLEVEIRDLDEVIEATWESEDSEEEERLDTKRSEVQERLDALEEQLETYAAFDPAEMANAGCLVSIGHDGELDLARGLVKPGDHRPAAAGANDGSTAAKEKPEFSQSLIADLKAYRTQAAQAEIASHPDIAFDLLVFHVACDVLSPSSFLREGIDVSFRQSYPRPSVEKDGIATKRLEAIREGLSLAWLEIDGEDERFDAFRQLPDDDKRRILAYSTALTLKPSLAGSGEFPSAYEIALSLTGGSVAEYWRPTKDNYLSRITREQLLAAGSEVMLSGKEWAIAHRDDKKGALVEVLDTTFAASGKPDTRDAIKNWLPKGMEFRAVAQEAEPIEAPKKVRKAKQVA